MIHLVSLVSGWAGKTSPTVRDAPEGRRQLVAFQPSDQVLVYSRSSCERSSFPQRVGFGGRTGL